MKSPSLSLFKLIKSLNKSEKRYLKLGLSDKQTEHIKLLNAIERQETYNESVLILENPDAAFSNNMAVYKSYLYKYILRRLSQYHKKSEQRAVLEKIQFTEILIDKKLFKQAHKQIHSAQKLAQKHQLNELLLLILKTQKELLILTKKANFDLVNNLYSTQKHTLHSLKLNTEYGILFNEISYLQIKIQKAYHTTEIEAMESWRKHPLLNVKTESLSLENNILFLKSIAIYHFTKDEVLKASQFNKQLLELLESEPDYNKRHPEQYISILNNYIIDQLALKNIPAFEDGLRQLEGLPNNPAFQQLKNIKVRIFYQQFLLFFNYCFSERAYKKAMSRMTDFKQQFKKYELQLQKHQRLTLLYLSGVINFGSHNYSDAQAWLTPILQETKEDVVQNIFRYARILNLLIHLELGNDEFLLSLLPITQRALSKQAKILASEKAIIQYLKKVVLLNNRKEKQQLKTQLIEQLMEFKQQVQEQPLFEYIPIIDYLTFYRKIEK